MAKKVNKADSSSDIAQEESLQDKYERLVNEIRPHLLTNAQLKSGNREVRAKYEKEKGYAAVLSEINAIGKELGYPKIGLGNLRS